jgi:hypothetical protein
MIIICPFYLVNPDGTHQTKFDQPLEEIKKKLEERQIVRQTQNENGSFDTEYQDGSVLVEMPKERVVQEQKFADFLCHPDNIIMRMGGLKTLPDGQMETTLVIQIPAHIVKEMKEEFPSLR